MLSVNNYNCSLNFGCKNQITNKIAEHSKEELTELTQKAIQTARDMDIRPVLKVDEWGRIISTKEECREILKHADARILIEARENIAHRNMEAEKRYQQYISNPTRYRRFCSGSMPKRPNFATLEDPVTLCKEYQRIVNERLRAEKSASARY